MIELTDKTLGLWFIATDPGSSDFMGGLETIPDGFRFTYRFRYYVDIEEKAVGKSEDIKRWYHWEMTAKDGKEPPTRATALDKVQLVISALESDCGMKADVILMGDGGIDTFGKELQAKDWNRTETRGQVLPFKRD